MSKTFGFFLSSLSTSPLFRGEVSSGAFPIAKGKRGLRPVAIAAVLALTATGLVSWPMVASADGCSLTAPDTGAGAAGSEANPYLIVDGSNGPTSPGDFPKIPACDGPGVHFKLVDTGRVMIQNNVYQPLPLEGHFDGNDLLIDILRMDAGIYSSQDYVGLFSKLEPGSSVKDLNFGKVDISGRSFVGAVAGYADGATVSGITIKQSVESGGFNVNAAVTFAGGVLGAANNTTLSNLLVVPTITGDQVRAAGFAGGIVGSYTAGSQASASNLAFLHTSTAANWGALQQAGGYFGGIFGELRHVNDFALNNSMAQVRLEIANTQGNGMSFGGLIGKQVTETTDPEKLVTLSFNTSAAAIATTNFDDYSNVGFLVGRSEPGITDGKIKISATDSYVTFLSDGPAADLEGQLVVGFSNTANATFELNGLVVGVEGDGEPFVDLPTTFGDATGVVRIEHSQTTDINIWQQAGFAIADGRDNAAIAAGNSSADWYLRLYDQSLIHSAQIVNTPVPIWLATSSFYADLEAPSFVKRAASITPTVESWVNVPENQRAYLDRSIVFERENDGTAYTKYFYVEPGVQCHNTHNTIPADAYPAGYFLPIWDNLTDLDSLGFVCERDGEPYVFSAEGSRTTFDLGFEVEIGGRNFDSVYLGSNGQIFSDLADSYLAIEPLAAVMEYGSYDTAIISGLGVYGLLTDSTNIWSARTTIAGKKAAVFGFEELKFDDGLDEVISFQIVLVENSPGDVEIWYNYDSLVAPDRVWTTTPSQVGVYLDNFTFDFTDHVIIGTNKLDLGEVRIRGTECREVFVYETLGRANQYTEERLAAIDQIPWYFSMKPVAGEPGVVEIFSDRACADPLVIREAQDITNDGAKIMSVGEEIENSGEGFVVGYANRAVAAGQRSIVVEALQNYTMAELRDGSTFALNELSLGTDVEGRIVQKLATFEPRTASSSGTASTPPGFSGPILAVPGSSSAVAPGGSLVIPGSNLNGIMKITIGGQDASFVLDPEGNLVVTIPVGLKPGGYDLVVTSDSGVLLVQAAVQVVESAGTQRGIAEAFSKRLTDGNSVKLYAKDLVGAGKVQFLLNGKEIAWVRAVDAADPKLSFANGFSYLVRTVDLAPGKNRFEILVDGERVFRATYVPRG